MLRPIQISERPAPSQSRYFPSRPNRASVPIRAAIFSPLVFARPLASTSLGNSPLTATFTFFQRSPIIYILMFRGSVATREIAAKPNLAFAGAIGNEDNRFPTRFPEEVKESMQANPCRHV